MRKVLLLLVTAMVTALGLVPMQTIASHNTGGDISYTYTGVANTYLLRYRFYRDQAGINAPAQINLCYSSLSAGLNGNAILLPAPGTGTLIPASPCVPAGSGYNIEEWIYEGTVVVPQAANDWIFDYSECCRNGAVDNVQPNGLYVYVKMDNLNYPTNSSPAFTSIPVTEFCVNNPFYWNQQAFDIDGDSLVYSVITAQDANGGCPYQPFPCTYISPYTPTDPLTTANGFNININTGVIYFTPTVQGTYVIAVLCEEFDPITGIKKGELNRDMQINVTTSCNIIPPAFDSTFQVGGINIVVDGLTSFCDDSMFWLTFDPEIQCGSVLPSDIRFTDPNGTPNPVVAAQPWNCANGLTDSVLVTLLYPIQQGTSYVYTKVGFDGNTFLSECGSSMPEFDSIAINLIDSSIYTFNANDTVGCSFNYLTLNTNQAVDCYTITSGATEFTLVDANGTVIPITGITCTGHYSNTFNFTVNPPAGVVGPLYLTTQNGVDGNTFTNACGTAAPAGDTIAVIQVLTYLPVNAGPDISQCENLPAPTLDAGAFSPTAVYSWVGPNGFTASSQQISANQTGTYIVNVSDGASCQGSDTVNITLLSAPSVNLGPDIQLCTNDPFPFLDAGNTGATYQWYYNGLLLPGEINQLIFPDTAGSYVVAVDLGGGCLGYDTVTITVNSQLVITLPTDQTLCSNDPLPVLDAGLAGATYQWSLGGIPISGATNQTYPVTGAGTYSVLVTSPTNCTGTDSYNLTIIPAPSVSIATSDTVYCYGDPVDLLDAGNAGATFQWQLNGTNISGATNQTFTPTQSGLYSVNVSNGGLCDAAGSVNIFIDQQLQVSVNDLTYCQGATGNQLTANTSNVGITYQWNFNGGQIAGATNSTYTPSQGGGQYSVTITTTSVAACSITSNIANVTEVPNPQPSLSNVNACDGAQVTTLNANATGNTYQWSLNGNAISGATNPSYTPTLSVGANTYSVVVTNTSSGVNCTGTAQMTYTVNANPTVYISDVNQCDNGQAVSLDAGVGATSYQWSTNANTQSISVSASGTYTVTITDANGCTGTASPTVTLNARPQPAIVDGNGEGNEVFFCDNPPYPVLSSGINNAAAWSWSLDGTLLNWNEATLEVSEPGIYSVLVTDANGCTNTDEITVIQNGCEVVVPNVFTPNGDGFNQVFFIENLDDFKTRKLVIYNRWGKEVFSANPYDNKWDGGDVSSGTYYWVLEYANENISETKHGIVTIIKE